MKKKFIEIDTEEIKTEETTTTEEIKTEETTTIEEIKTEETNTEEIKNEEIISEEKPKGKRGRKPKNKLPDAESDLLKEMEQYKKAPLNDSSISEGAPAPSDNAMQIDGYLLLFLIDSIFPFAISFIVKLTTKNDINFEKLKLNEKQFKSIEPIADKAAATVSTKLNPMTLLIISVGTIYTQNAIMLVSQEKTKKPKK